MRVIYICLVVVLAALPLAASEFHGQLTFNGLPLPGATVTATKDGQTVTAISNPDGFYVFPNLADGTWTMAVSMPGFAELKQDVQVTPNAPAPKWELKLLPVDQIKAEIQSLPAQTVTAPPPSNETPKPQPPSTPALSQRPQQPQDELAQRAADGLLINGSVNNGAASPFAQFAGFGNNRGGSKSLYTGGFGFMFNNSALNARPFSLTGQNTPQPAYNRVTGFLALGGPLQIPYLLKHGPNFFVNYQWTRNSTDTIQPALVPDAAERGGIFSTPIYDPFNNGTRFPHATIPQNRISPQALALLKFYPLPNSAGTTRYNYQVPILNHTHQDALQSRFTKTLNPKNQVYGRFAFLNSRADTANVFGFQDGTDILGINAAATWSRRFHQRGFITLGYQFSRQSTRVTPFFANRENVSGEAGILGNNQQPVNWGPPGLSFSRSGIAGLSDAQNSFNRNETNGVSYSMLLNHAAHNFIFGGDFRRQEFNYLSQQDPRGTFTFTGQGRPDLLSTGSDFADFLLGIPYQSSIAFGNPDKYFRESVYDAYINDDWRVSPSFTANVGIRWEYGAPITELFDRLVNLDVLPGFTAVAPVVANHPVGPLTGFAYPNSLVRPDKRGFEPRIGIAWRPIPNSSLVVRAGYGLYYDTSVYQSIALHLSQQPPLSKAFSAQTNLPTRLTLANGLNPTLSGPGTFGIDPNFRVGYAQNWQLTVQRDLPGSLQMNAMYLGIKGTRGVQDFLPNTSPPPANPCPACPPSGFSYLTSNGNSTRESVQLQLRRRLHSGFAGILLYTFSKSIDDDAVLGGPGALSAQNTGAQNTGGQNTVGQSGPGTGGQGGGPGTGGQGTQTVSSTPGQATSTPALYAQNWLDLRAERGLSPFDQRHLLSLQIQYTSGMGMKGGTLLSGWRGALFKEWSVATQITAGTGLPETPIDPSIALGAVVPGTVRPDWTGAPLYAAPPGLFLNPAAFVTPPPGQWGNARRGSITGPAQFSLDASLGRTFRVDSRLNLDVRVDSTNVLNHANFTAWNTVVLNPLFGTPISANPMRSLQTSARLRF